MPDEEQVWLGKELERPLLSETPVKNPEDAARLVKELVKTLCLSNATSFLMLYNHPGGSLSPSSQDVEITDRMS